MEHVCKFKDVAALWKEEKKKYVKRSTFAAYSLILTNHLLPSFGEYIDVKESDVQNFVFLKLEQGLGRKSVKDMLVVLKMVLRYGAKYELMPYRQMDVRFPTEEQPAEIPVLSRFEQKRIMDYTKDNSSYLNLGVYLCLSTGLRIGELCALRWEDINMENGIIKVSRTIQRIYIKEENGSHTELVIGSPKSVHSCREIPMTGELIRVIRPFHVAAEPAHYVLTNAAKPTEPRTYRNHFKKLMSAIGAPELKFHGLRHSFATRCIEGNCDYKTVSVLLGHANIGTTLNLYVHPDMEQKKRCIEQMSMSLR